MSSSTAWRPSPTQAERVRIMRDEMGPWLYEYIPASPSAPTHAIMGWGRGWANGP